MSYYGKGNNGRPVLLRKYDVTSAVSEVTFDGVFKGDFDWHYLVGVDVATDDASTSIRIMRRASGSDVTTTLDYMGQRGSNTSANENTMTNQTVGGYFDITADETGTDATRQTNSWVISYIANPTHMPTDWGRILTSGVGTSYGSAGDDWWHERTHQLIGSTGFDGVRIHCASGNISNGTFFIYGMA